jgi:cobalt-zinc-cadmium efflux system protein
LSRGNSLGERVLRWHLWEDVLGWVAVAIVGAALLVWDIPVLDPLLTILFTMVILTNVWWNLQEAVNLLLEGVPAAKPLAWVERLLKAQPGVDSVHDIHLWSLDGEQDLLSAHVVPTTARGLGSQLIRALKARVRRHGIEHAVFELEADGSCAGGAERRIRSHEHQRVFPSLFFAVARKLCGHPGRRVT